MSPTTMSIEPELSGKLQNFHDNVALTAQKIVFETFPQKILDLQALIESTSVATSPFDLSHAASSTDATVYPEPSESDQLPSKKRKRPTNEETHSNSSEHARYPALVHANEHLKKVQNIIKRECEELAQLCDKVKLWVNLTMPKIEDGDNFGVQVQEEAMNELHRAQESAYNLRDSCRQHHLNRAKICSKLIKYPNIEDYTLGLQEHDEKQLYFARQYLSDLRNIYAVITDVLHKNIAKIRAPKANNGVALY